MAEQSVLVVEDTDEIRELVITVLRRAGFDVREAGSGAAVPGGGPPGRARPDRARPRPARRRRHRGLPPDPRRDPVLRPHAHRARRGGRPADRPRRRRRRVHGQAVLARASWWPACRRCCASRAGRRPPSRRPPAEESVRRLAELEVDEESREVRVDGAVVDLTRTEFDLLAALASRPGRVLQRETLLREVWQTDWEGNLRLVEAHMSNLRRKLAGRRAELPGDPDRARGGLPARRRRPAGHRGTGTRCRPPASACSCTSRPWREDRRAGRSAPRSPWQTSRDLGVRPA